MLESPSTACDTSTDSTPVLAFIEIPKGSRNKYEFDAARGSFKLDRVLFSSVHYPADYGFIMDTLWDDGDPLDVLVLITEPTFTGCIIEARPIGGLDMTDERGSDFKVLAVPTADPYFRHVQTLNDLPGHLPKEIANFFETYKILEDKPTSILGWHDAEATQGRIQHGRTLYRQAQSGR